MDTGDARPDARGRGRPATCGTCSWSAVTPTSCGLTSGTSTRSSREASDELAAAPTTRDDIAIWKFTTGSTGTPKACVHPARSPLLSFDWYARGVLDISEDDVVLPVPKLFFGYARDLAALYPFGVGGAGIVFPERTTVETDLRADRGFTARRSWSTCRR